MFIHRQIPKHCIRLTFKFPLFNVRDKDTGTLDHLAVICDSPHFPKASLWDSEKLPS